ncbi:acyl-CoA thioesterase [Alicycliphilus denitrificans]|uniref:Thioesterase superfamily protein n=2 Tax=Alicycliphilus denitrificans TaxID=179636 RepID=F4G8W7_ALIDK|nr:hotdog domain-containing protein [Alicycliphilus denitrificans]ADU99648.1 thioesterase superfamily protein [Alicycliphilus denitrificans BC]AEB84476.1 thioesterase superfamily protein [Alicycliphilus denitrificans K601]QKD44531.1 acyl-CoA thioesterase [Alicycliphilus denitrificans]
MTRPPGTVETKDMVFPQDANHHGTLFAGQGLQRLARAALVAAREAAGCEVVMAAVTGVQFLAPVPVGRALVLRAWIGRMGSSSLTVCVHGLAEAPGCAPELVLQGVFELVAVDAKGRPRAIAAAYLKPETT